MQIDTNTLVSISEANQNFSKVARLVDQFGSAVILKNNVPKYMIMEFEQAEKTKAVSSDELMKLSEKLMKQNKKIYKELAK